MIKLFIDGRDISEMGLVLGEGSLANAIQWPPLKPVETNEWAEEAGIEADLSNPVLNSRQVTLKFMSKEPGGFDNLLEVLTRPGSHKFRFQGFGDIAMTLRLTETALNYCSDRREVFGLSFYNDTPSTAAGDDFIPDLSHPGGGLSIDGVDVAAWGVSVLDGTYQSLKGEGNIRPRLLVSSAQLPGAEYDADGEQFFGARQATIHCLLRQPTPEACIAAYYNLLKTLIQPGTRLVDIGWHKQWQIYYHSAACKGFYQNLGSGLYGIAFDISMNVTGSAKARLWEGIDYEVCDIFKADIPNPTSNQNWLTLPLKEYAREVSLKLRLDYLGHNSFISWSNDNHTAWGSIYWNNSSVKFQRYNSANAKTEYINAPINKGKWQDIIFKNRNSINVNGVDYQLPWYNITSLGGSTIADNGRGRTLIYFSDIKIGDKDVILPIKLIRDIPNKFLSSGTLSNKAGACGLLYNGIFYGARNNNHKFECYNN